MLSGSKVLLLKVFDDTYLIALVPIFGTAVGLSSSCFVSSVTILLTASWKYPSLICVLSYLEILHNCCQILFPNLDWSAEWTPWPLQYFPPLSE